MHREGTVSCRLFRNARLLTRALGSEFWLKLIWARRSGEMPKKGKPGGGCAWRRQGQGVEEKGLDGKFDIDALLKGTFKIEDLPRGQGG